MFEGFIFCSNTLAGLTDVINSIVQTFQNMGVSLNYLLAQMINFTVFGLIFYFVLLKPILRTTEERQRKIAEGLQYAEEMKNNLQESERKKSEILKSAGKDAAKIVQDAREEAKTILETRTKEAIAQCESMIRRSEENIAMERSKMVEEVKKDLISLVVDTTEKVLNKQLNDQDKTKFAEAAAHEITR